MIPLPLLPVIAAGLVPLIVGALWYHPRVFGTKWMSLKHITPDMADRSSRLSMHSTAIMLVLGIVCALILSRVLTALSIVSVAGGLLTALSLWIGFIIPGTVSRVLWDHVPVSLYLIETGQWLAALSVMSIVLIY